MASNRYNTRVIVTLTGENDAARQHMLTQLIDDFANRHGPMAIERLDGEETPYGRMAEAVASVSFLEPNKLVVLRTPSSNKEFVEQFETFCASVADSNQVILVERKLDKRLQYYKLLKKLTDFKEYAVLDGPGLVAFAVCYAREKGGTLSGTDARMLVERVGSTQARLQQELDKLLIHDPHISRTAIETLTEPTPAGNIFELLDSAFRGDRRRALELYAQQRALGVEPPQIVAMLAWQLHIFALLKTARSRSLDDIARTAKVSPYVLRKSQALVNRLPLTRLQRMVADLRVLDVRSKTESFNTNDALQLYLLTLAPFQTK